MTESELERLSRTPSGAPTVDFRVVPSPGRIPTRFPLATRGRRVGPIVFSRTFRMFKGFFFYILRSTTKPVRQSLRRLAEFSYGIRRLPPENPNEPAGQPPRPSLAYFRRVRAARVASPLIEMMLADCWRALVDGSAEKKWLARLVFSHDPRPIAKVHAEKDVLIVDREGPALVVGNVHQEFATQFADSLTPPATLLCFRQRPHMSSWHGGPVPLTLSPLSRRPIAAHFPGMTPETIVVTLQSKRRFTASRWYTLTRPRR